LPTYVPKGFAHQPSDGRQLGDSPKGSSLGGDPFRGPPFKPLVGFYGWPTLDPCMFILPWYQPPIAQPVLQLATKLPYKKL